ncbi:MAG: ABC transporter permease [Steroidobacteraceae bacterium]|jgi:osmoprotectant transport system permease protein
MSSPSAVNSSVARRFEIDPLSAALGLVAIASLVFLPFIVVKTSRIASGVSRQLIDALPFGAALAVGTVLAVLAAFTAFTASVRLRLCAALAGLVLCALTVARAADALTPVGNRIVRISPGFGFWVLLIAFGLIATNALTRFRLAPSRRVLVLALAVALLYAAFAGGVFDALSIMREYAVNADRFAREARQHVLLVLASLAPAVIVGVPIGILCHRVPRVRGAILQTLNLIQTIPSIALFGILMVPLAAIAAAYPLAAELGVHGIGAAPAVIALFLYALLPVVANTSVGLGRVSPSTVEAARGMGMTNRQVLWQVEFALALPVILTGIRIVLVQNIGLVTIAALIGGGGFGTFVFQGIGQTAIDLVLLGAIPTVALAFSCAVVLDALVDTMMRTPP